MRIKVWFYNKLSEEAKKKNCFINYSCNNELGISQMKGDEFVEVSGQKLRESEKAVQMNLSTGLFGGSDNGWNCWIPKSVIKED